MLQKMLRDHEKLRECAIRVRDMVDRNLPCDMTDLSKARWELASTLMQHLAFEDRYLYAKLLSDPRPHISTIGARFQSSLKDRFAVYAGHAKRWTPDLILADWTGYRVSAMSFIPDLLDRIDREERDLYPLFGVAGIDTETPMMTGNGWAREAFVIKDRIEGVASR